MKERRVSEGVGNLGQILVSFYRFANLALSTTRDRTCLNRRGVYFDSDTKSTFEASMWTNCDLGAEKWSAVLDV